MKNKRIILSLLIILSATCLCLFASCGASDNVSKEQSYNSETGRTNVQELSVDEGDIVKYIDGYIYHLQNDGFTVVKTSAGELSIVGHYAFTMRFLPIEMYVSDATAIIIGGLTTEFDDGGKYDYYYTDYTTCVAYAFDLSGIDGETDVDLTGDKLYSFEVNGTFNTSRLLTDSKDLYLAFTVKADDVEDVTTSGEVSELRKISYKENGRQKSFENIKKIPKFDGQYVSYRSTLIIKVDADEFTDDTVMTGYYGTEVKDFYMSENGLYPIFVDYDYLRGGRRGGGCYGYYEMRISYDDYIIKLDINDLSEKGTVHLKDFTIYDRYALKDYGEYVFVTATKDTGTGTSVLCLKGEDLSLVSRLDGIAEGEYVESVEYRTEGEKRYCMITTYRNTDPLFKVDVTDVNDMKVVGELKINGYSTYMHDIGGGKMISIGYDGTEQSANTSKVKVTLFDVSGDAPIVLDFFTVSGVYDCEAINNPHAFCLLGDNAYCFSATLYKTVNSNNAYKQGLYVFTVDGETLKEKSYVSNFDGNDYGEFPTWNIENYRKYVTRAFLDEGYLYTISDTLICSYDMDGLSKTSRTPVKVLDIRLNK